MQQIDYPTHTPIETIDFEGKIIDVVFDYEPEEILTGTSESICFIAAYENDVEIVLSEKQKTEIEKQLLES